MRNVVYTLGVSLDGYVETRDRQIDWSDPGPELHEFHNEQAAAAGAFLFGRRMYELMTEYWPTADDDPDATKEIVDFARIYRRIPKVVYSTTLQNVEWNSQLASDVAADDVAKLKDQPGGDLLLGGAGIAASFSRLGLIDEYRVFVYPIVLGGGTPFLAPSDDRTELELLETRTFGSGIVYLRYRRTGV